MNLKRWVGLALLLAVLTACSRNEISAEISDDTLFFDDFLPGQTGEWVLEGDDAGQTSIANSQLLININAPNTLQYAALSEQTFGDFVLLAEAQQISGSPESSYGVLFRMRSPQEFYRFEITGDGSYMLEKHTADGRWTRFIDDWRSSDAILPGPGGLNVLKVEARGSAIEVSVNDVVLETISDSSFAEGAIALDAGTFGQPGLEVGFDKVVVQPTEN